MSDDTPKQKKDQASTGMSDERPSIPEIFLKPYDPNAHEKDIYRMWEESGFFNPDTCVEKGIADKNAEIFSIVLPPPNVTGTLHMGHAAMLAVEDILVRYNRMLGKRTLWVPGTDSAALATQTKVEGIIYKEEKKRRNDIGREELLKRIEAFTEESKNTIIGQTKSMGSSLDWSRYAYTLDEQRYHAVMTAFVRMYDAGLIYRGARIVNWDPNMQTTVSDDEIDYVEQTDQFYYLKYGPFTIATARPETKFGDKYVVMHPNDARYKEYEHGQKIDLEWINGSITATVIKDEAIDMEFGSGVMTITPWHDATDFDIAERHKLEKEQIINERGILLPIAGEFSGQHIKKARAAIIEKLQSKGLVEKIEEKYVHNVATNSRGGGTIEPQIKEQWFVDVNKEFTMGPSEIPGVQEGDTVTLKKLMHAAVENGGAKIFPDRFEKIYYHWIDNLRDWCISRQIWYGHRIPVWYKDGDMKVQIESPGDGWQQDPDTLDTWFSSGLWTFSTLGWPWKREWDLKIHDGEHIFESLRDGRKRFETRAGKPEGAEKDWREFKVGDIVHFTLVEEGSEKVLSETEITKEIVTIEHFDSIDALLEKQSVDEIHPYEPETYRDWWETRPHFKDRIEKYGIWSFELKDPDLVTYHPTTVLETGYDIIFFWVARMILMSTFLRGQLPFKNVYLHGLVRDEKGRKMSKSIGNIINPLDMIEKFGADATRLSLIVGAAPGNDMPLSENKIKGYKHFANKLWNVSRFVLTNIDGIDVSTEPSRESFSERELEIRKEFHTALKEVSDDIERFNLYLAAEKAYHYLWHTFADVIIEESKEILNGNDQDARSRRGWLLSHLLVENLKMLHPFMPFVTETIWQELPEKMKDSEILMVARWPNKGVK